MRILLVNPNVTEAVTERMLGEARRAASPGTVLEGVTARFGAAYIENRPEAAIAGHAVLECLAARADGYDAAIVSAFGDPGLAAAKELMDFPVVGIAEAAFLAAGTLGRRIAVAAMTPRLGRWFEECAESYGLSGRVMVRVIAEPVGDIARAKEALAEPLIALCNRVVDEEGAEVVILGGGPLAGLAREAAERVPVPLLDGVSCAVHLAEMLVRLAPRPPQRGSFRRPGAKATQGLAPALERRLSGAADG